MMLYHRKSGALDKELETLEQCAPDYYRITNGHGKGFEALMRADVLYNRGDLDGAEILCQKAIYMADSRNQYAIYIAAYYILANIALYRGFKISIRKICTKLKLWQEGIPENPNRLKSFRIYAMHVCILI